MPRRCTLPLLAALLLATPALARAQTGGTTRQQIDRAIELYAAFNVEAARPILLNIVSPGYLQPVSASERVDAYKYLGASYALQGKRDSATTFFVAALDFDPFTDLDPRDFSAAEIGPFNEAKLQIFKVGMRPVEPRLVDPSDEATAYPFRLITTQRAALTVEVLRQSDNAQVALLYQGESNGLRNLPWRGILDNGQYADSTTYIIRATARPTSGTGAPVVTSQLFRVEQSYEPLEDTLPSFVIGTDLLPEEYPPRAPWNDLIKGGAMALSAIAFSSLALDDDLTQRNAHAFTAAGIGAGAAFISFSFRRQNRQIPDAVRENERRRQQRALFNAGVRARNEARLRVRKLIITPVAGVAG